MVSVKKLSLPHEYIIESEELIETLDVLGFKIVYAFWYLKSPTDNFFDGEWKLYIASESVKLLGLKEAYLFVLNTLSNNVIKLEDIELINPNWEDDKHCLDRIDIKSVEVAAT